MKERLPHRSVAVGLDGRVDIHHLRQRHEADDARVTLHGVDPARHSQRVLSGVSLVQAAEVSAALTAVPQASLINGRLHGPFGQRETITVRDPLRLGQYNREEPLLHHQLPFECFDAP